MFWIGLVVGVVLTGVIAVVVLFRFIWNQLNRM